MPNTSQLQPSTKAAVRGLRNRPYLVDAANFIRATRDSGYRGVAYAIAEFVDNSLQAGARRVAIEIGSSGDQEHPIALTIVDDGAGMAPDVLARALAFG